MKIKILISSFLFLISIILINVSSYAATWEFKWTDTVVNVPLGGNLSEYAQKPQARLYRDGVLLSDANISYNREGDWLYFMSNVNTTRIGTYKVWYKATENRYCPGTCSGYKALVSFVVGDSVPPTIDIINYDFFMQRIGSEPTQNKLDELNEIIKSNTVARDNYSTCEIILNHHINFTQTGTYEVEATAVDESNNRDTKKFNVIIFDSSYPVITFLSDELYLKLPLNGDVAIRNYFSAHDEVDGDISSLIEYPSLKLNEICEYDYTVTVKNKSGNMSSKTVRVKVVDDTPPTMTLTTHNLILDYKTDLESYDFSSKVKLSDNMPINYNNLYIYTDAKNKVGSYTVWFSYTDGVYEVSDEIELKCVSKEKPKIIADDIIIKTKSNVRLKDFITIIDDSDDLIYESLEIDDSSVNYSKEGTYYATAYAINSSGLSSTERIKVIIDNSLISGVNLPILIIMIIFALITFGYGLFFIYYFVIRKKKLNNKKGS